MMTTADEPDDRHPLSESELKLRESELPGPKPFVLLMIFLSLLAVVALLAVIVWVGLYWRQSF